MKEQTGAVHRPKVEKLSAEVGSTAWSKHIFPQRRE